MNNLRLSKQWRLEQRGDELYVLGGQDAVFTIDLEGRAETFFATLSHDHKFDPVELTAADVVIMEQLLSAKVLVPANKLAVAGKTTRVKVMGMDLKLPANTAYRQVAGGTYDFLLLVRTAGSLSDFVAAQHYPDVTAPHLFLDLAYEHTVSLGPLVFPGLTSCVACLQGRIASRWGDDVPPPEARSVSELGGLAAEWVAVELQKLFHDEDYTLVNKTLVLDTQARTITANKLHTVPLCPYCQKSELLSAGRLEYTAAKA